MDGWMDGILNVTKAIFTKLKYDNDLTRYMIMVYRWPIYYQNKNPKSFFLHIHILFFIYFVTYIHSLSFSLCFGINTTNKCCCISMWGKYFNHHAVHHVTILCPPWQCLKFDTLVCYSCWRKDISRRLACCQTCQCYAPDCKGTQLRPPNAESKESGGLVFVSQLASTE